MSLLVSSSTILLSVADAGLLVSCRLWPCSIVSGVNLLSYFRIVWFPRLRLLLSIFLSELNCNFSVTLLFFGVLDKLLRNQLIALVIIFISHKLWVFCVCHCGQNGSCSQPALLIIDPPQCHWIYWMYWLYLWEMVDWVHLNHLMATPGGT